MGGAVGTHHARSAQVRARGERYWNKDSNSANSKLGEAKLSPGSPKYPHDPCGHGDIFVSPG